MMQRKRGGPKQRVRTARRRSYASTRWLERQLNDPYVRETKAAGYRSRAAFKLIELNDKFHFLKGKKAIVDLGCAPGGWLQIIRKTRSDAVLVGVDILPMEPVDGAIIFEGDIYDEEVVEQCFAALGMAPDLVLSDMAANTIGHKQTDHLRTMALTELAAEFAIEHLVAGGAFVAKVFAGGTDAALLKRLKQNFENVKHAKPPASRKSSSEWYVVATGFRASAQ